MRQWHAKRRRVAMTEAFAGQLNIPVPLRDGHLSCTEEIAGIFPLAPVGDQVLIPQACGLSASG
ncbi:hypothetical protein MPLDJ20_110187 [Mesorhizobium plurifarium]|uniref:Uncharacterized protein n=1 Tax=Mesorhizobium plurifarium TaxID=69974 RepID=A0A090DPS3_MESPL|nr:hypothetical protein MPLDJ20_110187 [Mesorhizobium plurifarium]